MMNKIISTSIPVDQIGSNDDFILYSAGSFTYRYYHNVFPIEVNNNYPSNDISLIYPVGHDTISVHSWSGITSLYYGDNTSVFNSTYNYPVNYPVRSMGINGDSFYQQYGDTVYALNASNNNLDQWNILRLSGGNTIVKGPDFIDAELINYLDLDYMQSGTERLIAIVKPDDLMLYNLATSEYVSTGIANIKSFQYFSSGGNAFYAIDNKIYRIEFITGSNVDATWILSIPAGSVINDISLSVNGSFWVAASDGIYSTVAPSAGMAYISEHVDLKLFPNPTSESITIPGLTAKNLHSKVIISDISGKQVMEFYITELNQKVDVSGLACGMYHYHLVSSSGTKQSGKVIVSR